MPIVQVHLLEGRTDEQKRACAAGITDVICSTLKVTPDHVRVILSEMAPNHFAVGGTLAMDRPKS